MSRKKIARIIFLIILLLAVADFIWFRPTSIDVGIRSDNHRNERRINENTPYLEKEQKLSVASDDINELLINNPYGSVKIEGAEVDDIKIEAELMVYGKTEEKIEEIIDQVHFRDKNRGGELEIGIMYGELPEEVWGIIIDYKIIAPKRLAVDLHSSKYVAVDNFTGPVKVDHSGLGTKDFKIADARKDDYINISKISNIKNDVTIKSHFAAIEIDNIEGHLKVHPAFSNIVVDSVKGNLSMRSEQSKVNFNDIEGDITAFSSFGKIEANDINGDLKAELKHSPVTANVTGEIELDVNFSPVKLYDLAGDVDINSYHSSVDIYSALNHKLDIVTEHGSIIAHNLQLSVEKDNNHRRLIGNVGSGEYELEIDTEFGDVTFN